MGHQRTGKAVKEEKEWECGDLVMANRDVEGKAIAWPAKISRPEDWERTPDPCKCCVHFFGTNERVFVAPENIKAFTAEVKSKLSVEHKKTVQHFTSAVKEICEEFEELQHKSSSCIMPNNYNSMVCRLPTKRRITRLVEDDKNERRKTPVHVGLGKMACFSNSVEAGSCLVSPTRSFSMSGPNNESVLDSGNLHEYPNEGSIERITPVLFLETQYTPESSSRVNDVAVVAERPSEINSLTCERLEEAKEATSIGQLIPVAREKIGVAHSMSSQKDQFPSNFHPENQKSDDKRNSSGRHSVKGSVSGDSRSIRATFEEKIQTLTNSKESIKRATFVAFECAECGIANEIMELLIRKLETEPNFQKRVDLFFLVDSITQGAHWLKGNAAASYIPIVQASLPRLLEAAAPSGAGASKNRKQCLKVLQLWLERKILPGPCLQHFVDYFRVLNDGACARSFNWHPSQVPRAVDDPLRQIEGMLVNEYGSNAGLSFKFSPKRRGSDGICKDFENSSAILFSPPSPLDSPPPTPPLPSSPMPLPPPPSPPSHPPPLENSSAKRFSPPSPLDSPPPTLPLPSSPMSPPPPLSSPSPRPPPPPFPPHAYAPPPPFPAPSSQFTFLNKILQPPFQPVCATFSQEGYSRWRPVGNVGSQPHILLSGRQPPLERPIATNVGFQPTTSQILPSADPVSARRSGMPSTQGLTSGCSWRPA